MHLSAAVRYFEPRPTAKLSRAWPSMAPSFSVTADKRRVRCLFYGDRARALRLVDGEISQQLWDTKFFPNGVTHGGNPGGFAFAQITYPTGTSIYDSTKSFAVDAGGRGFYTISLGSYFLKTWGDCDASLRAVVSHSFSRSFAHSDSTNLSVQPSLGVSLALGGGSVPSKATGILGLH